MKNNVITSDSPIRAVSAYPEIRGNLFLAFLLGIHLVISLPKAAQCTHGNRADPSGTAQAQNAC